MLCIQLQIERAWTEHMEANVWGFFFFFLHYASTDLWKGYLCLLSLSAAFLISAFAQFHKLILARERKEAEEVECETSTRAGTNVCAGNLEYRSVNMGTDADAFKYFAT